MADFNFVRDSELKALLKSDYAEMESCIKVEAWKSVHVLAGSMIEAILTDNLVSSGYSSSAGIDPLKLDLAKLIEIAKQQGTISSTTSEILAAIKSYRNLVHPGRSVRLQEKVDSRTANIVSSLVGIVAEEVAKKTKETYGSTADQILAKITSDSTSGAILNDLLSETKEAETERLLLDLIPTTYFALDDADTGMRLRLRNCFRIAFGVAQESTKVRVLKRFAKMVKEESGERIVQYETAFFRAKNLQYLGNDDRRVVIRHILERLGSYASQQFRTTLVGLGTFLQPEDSEIFIESLVEGIWWTIEPEFQTAATDYLAREIKDMPLETRQSIVEPLNNAMKGLKKTTSFQDIVTRLEAIQQSVLLLNTGSLLAKILTK